jgi:hypothetical protein
VASIVNFYPFGVAATALFNFDDISQINNYRLSGLVNVSVSDAFTKTNYTQSIISSDIYTSASSGATNWSTTQLANIQIILDTYSQFANILFSKLINYSGYTPAQVGNTSDINISLIARPTLSFSGLAALATTNFGYTGGQLDIVLNTSGFGGGDTSMAMTTWGGHALMHEIGHSLGLSHPHSSYTNGVATLTNDFAATVNLGFSKLGFVIKSAADMNKEYFTIMSYDDQSPPTGPDTYAQTPMILDVMALQEAYGAGLGSTATGNDVITVGSSFGVTSFRTYFDTGGTDEVNLAYYTSGAYINLGVNIIGAKHLVGLSMSTADRQVMLAGSSPSSLRWFYGEYENVSGSNGNDVITGNALNNVINGAGGNDTIDGGGGFDTVMYSGAAANYLINVSSTGKATIQDTVATRDGTDAVSNIARLQFASADTVTGVNRIALDIGPTERAGSMYMLYQATFNRTPDPSGLGYWISKIDTGADIVKDIASFFVVSPEFVAKYGANPSNASYVNNLYQNVLHRTGEADGVSYWNQQLNTNAVSKAYVLEQFATLPEGAALVASSLSHGIAYVQWTA